MNKAKATYLPLFWSLLAVAAGSASCTKLAIDDCPKEAVLRVIAVDVEGEEIDDKDVIEGVVMYVFDNKQEYLQTVYTSVGNIEPLFFPDQDTLHLVTWGNLTDKNQQLPNVYPGTPMHEALVQLKPSKERQVRTIAHSPDDLFYSYDVISLKTGNYTESHKLYMSRASAAMSITMRNLQSYANRYDENYTLVVRETYNAIDFYGRLTGEKVGYMPQISFNDQSELVTPLFNLLPSHAEGVIEIDVYHDDELITTVCNDTNGERLKALRGQVVNVLVNFHLTVTVEVGITPWGTTQIWKEY